MEHRAVDELLVHLAHQRRQALHRERLHVRRLVVDQLEQALAHLALAVRVGLEGVLGELGEEVGGGHVAKVLVPVLRLFEDRVDREAAHRAERGEAGCFLRMHARGEVREMRRRVPSCAWRLPVGAEDVDVRSVRTRASHPPWARVF